MAKDELLALAERLEDYTPTMNPDVVICTRRTIDQAAAALRAQAQEANDAE